jgi:glycosyltransferase involved in cell wall biosynthesis
MQSPAEIVLTVTNDLSYDQRMQRIAGSLAAAGYKVMLVGRELPNSVPLRQKNFGQIRLKCRHSAGKLFYAEYNWRLYRFLVKYTAGKTGTNMALCAIDLDTILPVLAVSKQRRLLRVYDAHELFTELIEVKRRKLIGAVWNWVEKKAVPQFTNGYTVNDFIAGEFNRRYGVRYQVIRNMPFKKTPAFETDISILKLPDQRFFLYQGAVNEGRSFETLIPAMKQVDAWLVIAGDGNFMEQARNLVKKERLESKIMFTGMLQPDLLQSLTPWAYAGITIFEALGMNQYYSLANRYFDYIQAGIPQICVNYPEYAALNARHQTALLIPDVQESTISNAMNKMLENDVLHSRLQRQCATAAEEFCWQNESKKLTEFWKKVLPINQC